MEIKEKSFPVVVKDDGGAVLKVDKQQEGTVQVTVSELIWLKKHLPAAYKKIVSRLER